MQKKWKTHNRREIYRSKWIELWLDDIEVPSGRRFEHHVLRFPRRSTTAIVIRDDKILMIWRHRFITDTWGWEVPAGWADIGEDPANAIRREIEEETGWRVQSVKAMNSYYAINGIGDMQFTVFLSHDAIHIGNPADTDETECVGWIPIEDLPRLIATGMILDGPTLMALSYYLGVYRPLHTS